MRAWKRVHSYKHVSNKNRKKAQDNEISPILQKEQNLMTEKLMDQNVRCIFDKETEIFFIASYGYRLPFLQETMYDSSFDMLTPDREIYLEMRVQINIDFFPEYFTISDNGQKYSLVYNYNDVTKKLLWCLQNDISIFEIIEIVRKLDISSLMCGHLLINFIDNRFDPVKEHSKIFYLNPGKFTHTLFSTFNHEIESKEVLRWKPIICTSPSPDLARFESVMDWRSKVFIAKDYDKCLITPPEDLSEQSPMGLIPLFRRRAQRGTLYLDVLDNPPMF